MNILKTLIGILFFIPFTSCFLIETDENDKIIAKVGDSYLKESEIIEITADNNSTDSLEIANAYIDNWIKEQLIIEKAYQNLNESQYDFEKQLLDYKNSLLIYVYENQLVKQKLDTVVSIQQMQTYYTNNSQNFELREDLIKARVVKILNSAPNQDSVSLWLKNYDQVSVNMLTEYCTQFSVLCELDTNKWNTRLLIESLVPMNEEALSIDLSKKGYAVYKDSIETMFINITDYKKAGETSPLNYVKEQIMGIIRNRRRLELLNSVREEIFEEATLKKKYEVFK